MEEIVEVLIKAANAFRDEARKEIQREGSPDLVYTMMRESYAMDKKARNYKRYNAE